MPADTKVRETVLSCLRRFLESTGRTAKGLGNETDLMRDVAMSSDEGVDFVIDLCDAFRFEFPNDFNPFVHSEERRGRRIGEMIDAVASLLSNAGATR